MLSILASTLAQQQPMGQPQAAQAEPAANPASAANPMMNNPMMNNPMVNPMMQQMMAQMNPQMQQAQKMGMMPDHETMKNVSPARARLAGREPTRDVVPLTPCHPRTSCTAAALRR